MPRFVNPTGLSSFGIGLCDRCRKKFPLGELVPDPDSIGLMVCRDDVDIVDPYRLPARGMDNTTLPYTRPDADLTFT